MAGLVLPNGVSRERAEGLLDVVTAVRLRRVSQGGGRYETVDGRYEVSYEEYVLPGECECAVCLSGSSGCPNGGFGKRAGWHIWDRHEGDYAIFAHEPQMFQTLAEARVCLAEALS